MHVSVVLEQAFDRIKAEVGVAAPSAGARPDSSARGEALGAAEISSEFTLSGHGSAPGMQTLSGFLMCSTIKHTLTVNLTHKHT